uniref:MYND-type domain-containing protein n=1 Tax=Strigamia maritima TaxID=126957 RepID=T1IZN9_STRMM
MFAALSGNIATTLLLLQSGASVNAINSVGRTASQMAAFVGNHTCVSVINTFISQDSIDYYTKPQGLESEAKLPSHLSGVVHRLVVRVNIHPVGIVLFLQQHPILLDYGPQVVRVLQAMSEKEMKRKDTNEVLGFKLHLLAYVVEFSCKKMGKDEDKEKTLNGIIKLWVKGRPEDGFAENLELFIRQGIRQFQYPDSAVLQQLVRSLAPVKIGDDPTALSLVCASINGQRMAVNDNVCATCGDTDCDVKKCSSCKSEQYCSHRCQKLHWSTHKQMCPFLAQQRKEVEAENAGLEEAQQKLE